MAASSTAAGTTGSAPIPAAINDVGTYGEDLYDQAKLRDWAKAKAYLDSLHAATMKLPSDERIQSQRRALESAISFDPAQASPHYALADLAEKQGDLPRELSALRALAGLEQHEPNVYQRLLRRLNQSGAFEEAARVGEAALYADISGLTTHQLFAESLLGAGNRARAKFELESAALCEGSDEDHAEVHARLAELYASEGQQKKAKQQVALARKLDPKNERLTRLPH